MENTQSGQYKWKTITKIVNYLVCGGLLLLSIFFEPIKSGLGILGVAIVIIFSLLTLRGVYKCPLREDEIYEVWKKELPAKKEIQGRAWRTIAFTILAAALELGAGYLIEKKGFCASWGSWKDIWFCLGILLMYIVKDEYVKGPSIKKAKEVYSFIMNTLQKNESFPFTRFRESHRAEITPDTSPASLCISDLDYYTLAMLYSEVIKMYHYSLDPIVESEISSAWKDVLDKAKQLGRVESGMKEAAGQASINAINNFGRVFCRHFKSFGDYALWIQFHVKEHSRQELANSF